MIFFCTCCCKNFSCDLYILSTGKNYWLKEKRMSVSPFFFYAKFMMNKKCMQTVSLLVFFDGGGVLLWGQVSTRKISYISDLMFELS